MGSRNSYDSATDTLKPIMGWPVADTELSSSSERPVRNNVLKAEFDKTYKSTDSSFTDLADGDYIPVQDVSASAKKKTTWSNIVTKMKAAFGIASSGDTYLKKDGTWGTPTNTTYSSKAAVSGGTDVSLVTTGEKYTWNTKTGKIIDSNYRTPYFEGNLNDITETCVVNAVDTCTNLPTAEWYFVATFMHCNASTYGAQIAVDMNSGKEIVYIRSKSGGTWGSWRKQLSQSDIVNSLDSSATDKPLSAAQGKALQEGKQSILKAVDYQNTSTGTINAGLYSGAIISVYPRNYGSGVICGIGKGADENHTSITCFTPAGAVVTDTNLIVHVIYATSISNT